MMELECQVLIELAELESWHMAPFFLLPQYVPKGRNLQCCCCLSPILYQTKNL